MYRDELLTCVPYVCLNTWNTLLWGTWQFKVRLCLFKVHVINYTYRDNLIVHISKSSRSKNMTVAQDFYLVCRYNILSSQIFISNITKRIWLSREIQASQIYLNISGTHSLSHYHLCIDDTKYYKYWLIDCPCVMRYWCCHYLIMIGINTRKLNNNPCTDMVVPQMYPIVQILTNTVHESCKWLVAPKPWLWLESWLLQWVDSCQKWLNSRVMSANRVMSTRKNSWLVPMSRLGGPDRQWRAWGQGNWH